LTLFFIHPNILFPHPKNSAEQYKKLNKTAYSKYSSENAREKVNKNEGFLKSKTSGSKTRKCQTADAGTREFHARRLKDYIKMERMFSIFRKTGGFCK
jgi:hypothetical protein